MLYDEPTTGLDPIMSDVINELILQTQQSLKTTGVVVTHDMKTVDQGRRSRDHALSSGSARHPTSLRFFTTARPSSSKTQPTRGSASLFEARRANGFARWRCSAPRLPEDDD